MTADLITRLRQRADHIPGNGEFSQIGVLLREAADALEMHVRSRVAYERDLQRLAAALEQAEKALREIAARETLPNGIDSAILGREDANQVAREALAALGGREDES